MRRSEDQLQRSIVTHLRWVLPKTHRVFAVPNGGSRTAAEGGILKATGVLAGVPDLVILGPGGCTLWIEVKTETGRLSPAQKDFRQWMIAHGVPHVVARSLDHVLQALDHYQIKTREAA